MIIGEDLVGIGNYAFYECTGLNDVEFTSKNPLDGITVIVTMHFCRMRQYEMCLFRKM